jgi:glycosyltransferase involved in cell wall biosynthesis
MVRPGITGYLAKPEDCEDFSNGIVELLSNEQSLKKIGHNCREIALNEYTYGLQAQRHFDLYRGLHQKKLGF